MSTNYGPKIVTDGLVLALDAADRSSYSGSGTTWNDLSGNNNNGTLVNGPTYDDAESGSLVFDGTSSYVSLGTPASLTALFETNAVSIDVWLKRSANITDQKVIFDSGEGECIQMDILSNQLSFAITTSSSITRSDRSIIDLDIWYNYVGVYDGTTITTYLNSTQKSQNAQTGNITTDSGGFSIASYGSGLYFPGEIATLKVYSKALSEDEVLQNFNALKGRFGVSKIQSLIPGLAGKFFNGDWRSTIATGNIGTLPLTSNNDSSNVNGTNGLPSAEYRYGVHLWSSIEYGNNLGDNYGFIAIGYFTPPTTGTYTIYTSSDDGSGVWIGDLALPGATRTSGNATLNNGLGQGQGNTERSSTVSLTAGVMYPIRIVMEEVFGGDNLTFSWSGPGISKTTDLLTYFGTPVKSTGELTGDYL